MNKEQKPSCLNANSEEKEEWDKFALWVQTRAAEIREGDEPYVMPGQGMQPEMIRYWREYRPKMVKQMEARGLLDDLAFVLNFLAKQAEIKYRLAGMRHPDRRQLAQREWLLMEPEEEEEEEEEADDDIEYLVDEEDDD